MRHCKGTESILPIQGEMGRYPLPTIPAPQTSQPAYMTKLHCTDHSRSNFCQQPCKRNLCQKLSMMLSQLILQRRFFQRFFRLRTSHTLTEYDELSFPIKQVGMLRSFLECPLFAFNVRFFIQLESSTDMHCTVVKFILFIKQQIP